MFAALIDDLARASTADLDAALADAKRSRDEADMRIAAITAVVDSRQLFQDHGHRSVTGYLKQQLNCSAVEAGRIKSRARLINRHPDIGDALGASRIGAEAVTQLATAHKHPRAGERFDEFATMLTDQAERLEHSDLVIAVKHFVNQADPDGAFGDQEFHDQQRTASVRVDSGAIDLHAFGGDPIRAVEMHTVFERAVQAEAHKDFEARRIEHGDDALAHPMPRTNDQRKFDAMYEIFIGSVTAPADGKRPEPLVNLVVDAGTGVDVLVRHHLLDVDVDVDDRVEAEPVDPLTQRCQTSTGVSVHPDAALKAMIRGSVRRVVVDAHNVVIDMGRKQRLFTGKAREAAKLMVVRCGHRGCDIPAEFCDVDHLDEWAADTGATDQVNSFPLCNGHDIWKHRKRLRGRRDSSGRIHLIRPDGTVIKPLGARDPVWAESDGSPSPRPELTTPDQPTAEQTTWAELTKNSTAASRHTVPADALVQIIDLRAA